MLDDHRPGVVKVIEQFKHSVYGDQYESRSSASDNKMTEASKKRKANAENALKECENYDWAELADSGKVKESSLFVFLLSILF